MSYNGTERLDILAIDATHPDEEPAGEPTAALYSLLKNRHIRSRCGLVTPVLGNIAALIETDARTGRPRRQLDINLVLADPNPVGNREERRMAELAPLFADHDVIFDRHGNRKNIDWAFCHPEAVQQVWGLIGALGITQVLHYMSPHFASRYKNYLGVDLHPDSWLKSTALRDVLAYFIDEHNALDTVLPVDRYDGLQSISMDEAKRLGLPDKLDTFDPIPEAAVEALGYPSDAVVMGVDVDKYGYTGCYAEVVIPAVR